MCLYGAFWSLHGSTTGANSMALMILPPPPSPSPPIMPVEPPRAEARGATFNTLGPCRWSSACWPEGERERSKEGGEEQEQVKGGIGGEPLVSHHHPSMHAATMQPYIPHTISPSILYTVLYTVLALMLILYHSLPALSSCMHHFHSFP
jgi:hypothetical protein